MSALQNEIDKLKTLKESYDELSRKVLDTQAVLTELNNGKQEMVDALATKNVQSSTDKTLVEIAGDVRSIAQSPITIDGGELYEKQLFGAPTDKTSAYEQPDSPLWNLYQVMANLLNDGRFIEYQGIALCEYDVMEDTISLNSAGTGGAYFTSDLEFIEYDTEYVWKDIDHTKLNRWVAYLFSSSNKTFEIPKNTINLYVGMNILKVIYSQSDKKLIDIVTEFGDIGELDMVSRYTNKGNFFVRGIQQNSESTIIDATAITNIIIDGIEINYPIINVDKTHKLGTIYVKSIKSNVKNGDDTLRVLTYNNIDHCTLEVDKIVIEDGLEWGTLGLIRGNNERKSYPNGRTMKICGIKTLKSPIMSSESRADFDTTEYMEFQDLLSLECSPIKANTNNGFGSHLSAIIAKNATLKSLNMSRVTFYNLIDLDFKSIEGSIYGNKWSNVDIINDPDKMALLNKNIREHIVARAIDGNNTLTFTINSGLYAKLEQETLDAFAAKNWIVAGA